MKTFQKVHKLTRTPTQTQYTDITTTVYALSTLWWLSSTANQDIWPCVKCRTV